VAISVGVFREHEPYLGVVYNPVLNECYHAVKGEGAFLNETRIGVTAEAGLKEALVATGFPYTIDKNRQDYDWTLGKLSALLPKVRDIRRFGSASLDLCHVARGSLEGYYEMNLKPWDVAAGMVILTEAGGEISNQNGERYDPFADRIIVASNGKIHGELIGYLRD
jgi:myo-inositol-1(or 4)-monophosphatase